MHKWNHISLPNKIKMYDLYRYTYLFKSPYIILVLKY